MIFRRVVDVLTQDGLAGIPRRIRREVAAGLDRMRPSVRRWHAAKAQRDRAFDAAYGVDTGGAVALSSLSIASENRQLGVNYLAIDPDEFDRGVEQLALRFEDFVFVDLGSGKGRALLLASRRPFKKIVGVEFSVELHTLAQKNIARYQAPEQRCRLFDVRLEDATKYELPEEPLVVFLYNPFGAEVMRQVAERVRASHQLNPRPLFVLYVNPFQESVWLDAGFTAVTRGDPFVILQPSRV